MDNFWQPLDDLRIDDCHVHASTLIRKTLANDDEKWKPYVIPPLKDAPQDPIVASIERKSVFRDEEACTGDRIRGGGREESDAEKVGKVPPELRVLEDERDVWLESIGRYVDYKVSVSLPSPSPCRFNVKFMFRIISSHGTPYDAHTRLHNCNPTRETPHS